MGRLDLDMELERGDRSVIDSPENNNQVTTEAKTTDIFKNYDLYLAAKNGDLNDFKSILHRISSSELISSSEILCRVSPIGNTFFHVAAIQGNKDMVNYIAAEDPSTVLQKNFNGDTALHLAAKVGDESMVKALVLIHHDLLRLHISQSHVGTEDDADKNNLLRAKNERGNTALHESIINGRELIAQYLIKEDPELLYIRNKQGKYVLNLAANAGFANCVSSILECSIDHGRLNDQFKESSPIKAAIMNKNRELLEIILNSSPRFIKLQDGQGRTPLHYAASSGYVEVVHYLVGQHASGVIQRDKSGSFPIHLAAIEGHVDTISLLLKLCPADPVELLDKSGRNILHLALHLATMNWHPEIVSALTWDERVDIKLSNDKWMTALDAADFFWWDNPPFRQVCTELPCSI